MFARENMLGQMTRPDAPHPPRCNKDPGKQLATGTAVMIKDLTSDAAKHLNGRYARVLGPAPAPTSIASKPKGHDVDKTTSAGPEEHDPWQRRWRVKVAENQHPEKHLNESLGPAGSGKRKYYTWVEVEKSIKRCNLEVVIPKPLNLGGGPDAAMARLRAAGFDLMGSFMNSCANAMEGRGCDSDADEPDSVDWDKCMMRHEGGEMGFMHDMGKIGETEAGPFFGGA